MYVHAYRVVRIVTCAWCHTRRVMHVVSAGKFSSDDLDVRFSVAVMAGQKLAGFAAVVSNVALHNNKDPVLRVACEKKRER